MRRTHSRLQLSLLAFVGARVRRTHSRRVWSAISGLSGNVFPAGDTRSRLLYQRTQYRTR
ncbi:MAG: hypothetical protein IID61_07290 [SAR324 cluster bacterium]|nr:hypothetical protein [SAR324 cluster bacterium]